jgi:mannosyltransferase OCH1-like enzyme
MFQDNPKILHRIYFKNFAPFRDPYEHYLETWRREMPGYKIMQWDMGNLDVYINKWTRAAFNDAAPVFLSEYFRWHVLHKYGGVYIDADCEILDGKALHGLIEELYAQSEYDVFFGVEERSNGHPTAQTVAAKRGADLVEFMKKLYEKNLATLWPWREKRGLIGPQLMSLYFLRKGINVSDDGFFKNIDHPLVAGRAKIYPQKYFSPKFTILGATLDYEEGKSCVYHLFANANVDFARNKEHEDARNRALTFSEYREALARELAFPRKYRASRLKPRNGKFEQNAIVGGTVDGLVSYGPYITLPKGVYTGRVLLGKRSGKGTVRLSVTAKGGQLELSTRIIDLSTHGEKSLSIPFALSDVTEGLEVTVSIFSVDHIEILELEVDLEKDVDTIKEKTTLKVLHRVYFGFDGKPDIFANYLKTWKAQLPDFEIRHWNADNLPMQINSYVTALHQERDHAFLTDFFRWYLLREFGGVYLDADVEIVNGNKFRTLIDDLEATSSYDAFIGIDERSGGWYTAHSMASKPNSTISRFMCDVYENFGSFKAWRKKGLYFWAPQLVGLYFANEGHNVAGMGTTPDLKEPRDVAGVRIYPQDWFSPLAPSGKTEDPFILNGLSDKTSLCHHFACSWHSEDSIYLSYSKEKGGQATALLADIVNRQRYQRFLAASSSIQTVVGEKNKEGITTTGKSGYLSYGPYIHLSGGEYCATYTFSDLGQYDQMRVDVVSDSGGTTIAKHELGKKDSAKKAVVLKFKLADFLSNIEFRVHVGEESKATLTEIIVEKL